MARYVLITRHPADCGELQEMLRPSGIILRPYPVLRVADVDDRKGWKRAMRELAFEPDSSWLVLASPRAADRLVDQASKHGENSIVDLPAAVVGQGTAKAAREAGLRVEVVGGGTGMALAQELIVTWEEPTVAVFACGRERREELPRALTGAGHTVLPIELYAMRPTPPRELPPLGPSLEAVILTSPRSAHYYLEGVGGRPLPCTHWALGPTTRAAAETMGIACRIPPEPNLESLAEELCKT